MTLARGGVLRGAVATMFVGLVDMDLDRAAGSTGGERLLDDLPIGMFFRKQAPHRAADGIGRQHGLHRRVGEEQLAGRIEERHGIFQVLDRRLQVRLLPREVHPIGRELLTDRVEKCAELAELVTRRQIEGDAELAFAEPREAAAEDVNGPQQQAGEEARDNHRHAERGDGGVERGKERRIQLLTHQEGGDADADGAELLLAKQHRLAHFECLPFPRVEHTELPPGGRALQRGEIAPRREPLALTRRIARGHDHAARIEHHRIHDALAVDAGFEDGSQPGIGPKRGVGIRGFGDDLAGAVKNRVREQLSARLALVERDAREPREMEGAERDDGEADNRRHGRDLLAFDAETHLRAADPLLILMTLLPRERRDAETRRESRSTGAGGAARGPEPAKTNRVGTCGGSFSRVRVHARVGLLRRPTCRTALNNVESPESSASPRLRVPVTVES